MRFSCDDHVRRLARWLRAAGFDTAWEAEAPDAEILRRCRDEDRTLLTLDRRLAKRAGPRGCLLPSHDPLEQLRFVKRRFGLDLLARAFTRCTVCNEELVTTRDPDVPPRVRESNDRFTQCPRCGRVFWEGDHVRNMRARFESIR